MADDIAPHGAEVAHSGLVSLRRELWRQHVQLREIGPDDLRYAGAATEVLDLTTRLLAAEEAVAAQARAARRRATVLRYAFALGATAAVLTAAALLPGLGTVIPRVAIASAVVLIALTATALARWRHARVLGSAPANQGENPAATDPATGPLPTPDAPPARSSP